MKNVIELLMILCVAASGMDAAEIRQWKDTRGNVIEAKLLKDNGNGTISIQKPNGWRGDVPLNLLSPEDQEYVKKAAVLIPAAPAEPVLSPNFEISRIRREFVPGYISTQEGWEYRIKSVRVDLRYKGPAAVENAYVKAYFYDRDGKEIERFGSPPRRQDENGKYLDAIARYEPGEKYEVFFPISKAAEKSDWKTVLVTFGNANEAAALADPRVGFMTLNFDEKKILFPDLTPTPSPARPVAGDKRASSTLLPELKSVKRDESPYSVQVDRVFKNQHDCLMSEVRVKGGLPRKVSVSAYFFDEAKNLVETHGQPAMAAIGGGTYSSVPAIVAENEWYPVFFAIDTRLEKLKWKWAVVVFLADDRAAAEVFGPRGVTISDFKFPGKEKMIAKEELK